MGRKSMPHPGDKIHIPLDEETAIRAFFQVKPTKDMPRPGASKTESKPKQHWVEKGSKAACGAVVASPKKRNAKITCRSCLALLARERLRKEQQAIRNG
jgi:hypothetical protein